MIGIGLSIPELVASRLCRGGATRFSDEGQQHLGFSDGGLTVTSTSTGFNTGAVANVGTTTSKKGFEITPTEIAIELQEYVAVGFASEFPGEGNSDWLGESDKSIGWWDDGGVFYNDSVLEMGFYAHIESYQVGDKLYAIVDPVAGKFWFRVNNGHWNNDPDADPSAGTGAIVAPISGPIYPACTLYIGDGFGDSFTANFGATPYAHALPSGFGDFAP